MKVNDECNVLCKHTGLEGPAYVLYVPTTGPRAERGHVMVRMAEGHRNAGEDYWVMKEDVTVVA